MISREFLSFFPDLSMYQTDSGLFIPEVVNIGWLSPKITFQTGSAPNDFIDKLKRLIKESAFSQTKLVMGRWDGTFTCPLCEINNWEIQKRIPYIGNAEIWIPSKNREKIYSSSTWICHYIIDHQYLPPDEYIESILLLNEEEKFNADIIAFDLKIKHQSLRDGIIIDQEYQKYIDSMHSFLESSPISKK
jgi:hypothetical protein